MSRRRSSTTSSVPQKNIPPIRTLSRNNSEMRSVSTSPRFKREESISDIKRSRSLSDPQSVNKNLIFSPRSLDDGLRVYNVINSKYFLNILVNCWDNWITDSEYDILYILVDKVHPALLGPFYHDSFFWEITITPVLLGRTDYGIKNSLYCIFLYPEDDNIFTEDVIYEIFWLNYIHRDPPEVIPVATPFLFGLGREWPNKPKICTKYHIARR